MAVDQLDVVDFVGIDPNTDEVLMAIGHRIEFVHIPLI